MVRIDRQNSSVEVDVLQRNTRVPRPQDSISDHIVEYREEWNKKGDKEWEDYRKVRKKLEDWYSHRNIATNEAAKANKSAAQFREEFEKAPDWVQERL